MNLRRLRDRAIHALLTTTLGLLAFGVVAGLSAAARWSERASGRDDPQPVLLGIRHYEPEAEPPQWNVQGARQEDGRGPCVWCGDDTPTVADIEIGDRQWLLGVPACDDCRAEPPGWAPSNPPSVPVSSGLGQPPC